MSETENLKKGVMESKARQQVDAVSAYLDTLTKRIDESEKRETDAWRIYFIVWLAWMIIGFTGNAIAEEGFQTLFFLALIYSFIRTTNAQKAYSEFFGAIEILRILGMIPPRSGGKDRKRVRFWEEGASIVKGWFEKKEKAQKEVYAPV